MSVMSVFKQIVIAVFYALLIILTVFVFVKIAEMIIKLAKLTVGLIPTMITIIAWILGIVLGLYLVKMLWDKFGKAMWNSSIQY